MIIIDGTGSEKQRRSKLRTTFVEKTVEPSVPTRYLLLVSVQ